MEPPESQRQALLRRAPQPSTHCSAIVSDSTQTYTWRQVLCLGAQCLRNSQLPPGRLTISAMATCPSCSAECSALANFCSDCGCRLSEEASAHGQRRREREEEPQPDERAARRRRREIRRESTGDPARDAVKAAEKGDVEWLRELPDEALRQRLDLAAPRPGANVRLPQSLAMRACLHGHVGVLHELVRRGLGEVLTWPQGSEPSSAEHTGFLPQHCAAQNGHEDCLQLLHQQGADLGARQMATSRKWGVWGMCYGWTPAHYAAARGHPNALRTIALLQGPEKLCSTIQRNGLSNRQAGETPAHLAAHNHRLDCLKALHECIAPLCDDLSRKLMSLTQFKMESNVESAEAFFRVLSDLQLEKALAAPNLNRADNPTPAMILAESDGYTAFSSVHALVCLRYLRSINGLQLLQGSVLEDPHCLFSSCDCVPAAENTEGLHVPMLLADPGLLDLQVKQSWLAAELKYSVGNADAEALSLVATRSNVLSGLCGQLGIDETTGEIAADVVPLPLDVRFHGENGGGDGLRRELFDTAVTEITSPEHGLWMSRDDGRTLQPNPNSGVAAPDHLAHFALLGRVCGLALFHREQVNVRLTPAFVKAAIGPAPALYCAHGEIVFVELPAPDGYASARWPALVNKAPDADPRSGYINRGAGDSLEYFVRPISVDIDLRSGNYVFAIPAEHRGPRPTEATTWSHDGLWVPWKKLTVLEGGDWAQDAGEEAMQEAKSACAQAPQRRIASAYTCNHEVYAGLDHLEILEAALDEVITLFDDEQLGIRAGFRFGHSTITNRAATVRKLHKWRREADAEQGRSGPAEFDITCADLESVDPVLFENKVKYLRDAVYSERDQIELEDMGLVFEDDGNDHEFMRVAGAAPQSGTELKPGGREIAVTEENKQEYLDLLVKHRLVEAIRPQIEAFQRGLGVFLSDEILSILRCFTTVADMQQLMCGSAVIDVDDWERHTEYKGAYDEQQDQKKWFWEVVRQDFDTEQRAKLLAFVTGSACAPATGFANLVRSNFLPASWPA